MRRGCVRGFWRRWLPGWQQAAPRPLATTRRRYGEQMWLGRELRTALRTSGIANKKHAIRSRRSAIVNKKRVSASGRWHAPIQTEIVDAGPFTLAEDYHQKYLQKNPGGYTCHYLRD